MTLPDLKQKIKTGELTPLEGVQKANSMAPKIRSGASVNTRTFSPKKRDEIQGQYFDDKAIREATLKNKLPLINPAISETFYLSQGLVLMGGVSGNGKSTVSANILAGFLQHGGTKQAVVITNEESTEAVYNRVACVILKVSFNHFQRGELAENKIQAVEDLALTLMDRIIVVDDAAWDMTCIEDVQAVLEYATNPDVGIVLIDYLQTVAFSRTNPQLEPFQVSKKLGLYLKDYGRRVGVPLVTFAQLKTQSEESNAEFKDRVENDKTIYNHAYQVVEIVPDKAAKRTKFVIWKDRYGYAQGLKLEAQYDDGRFIPVAEL